MMWTARRRREKPPILYIVNCNVDKLKKMEVAGKQGVDRVANRRRVDGWSARPRAKRARAVYHNDKDKNNEDNIDH